MHTPSSFEGVGNKDAPSIYLVVGFNPSAKPVRQQFLGEIIVTQSERVFANKKGTGLQSSALLP